MDIDIKELIKTASENLNLKDFKGDVVAFKYVENEIGNMEEGAIFEQNNYYYGTEEQQKIPPVENEEVENDEEGLVDLLMPLFYNNKNNVQRYLQTIKGMKDVDITHYTYTLVQKNEISDISCHRPLWKILHENGIYKATESTWNRQLV